MLVSLSSGGNDETVIPTIETALKVSCFERRLAMMALAGTPPLLLEIQKRIFEDGLP